MKLLVATCLALACATSALHTVRLAPLDDASVPAKTKFTHFKYTFKKSYATVEQEALGSLVSVSSTIAQINSQSAGRYDDG